MYNKKAIIMEWKHKYEEMGSRNKKTGKLNNYVVTRTHKNGNESFECSCPATLYRPWLQACKHIKRLKEKTSFFAKKKLYCNSYDTKK